jgi:2-polyprenyl-6-methoxyphenol hydroxylase-like FAD-dependent oxidoreductase
VSASIRGQNGDHVVQAKYLVGCDGMHSMVRDQACISFDGGGYDEEFILADVHMDWPLPRDEVTLFYAPAGLMVVAPIPGDRYRIVATMKQAPPVPATGDVQALLETRGPATAQTRVRDIVWSSRFHVQHRLARTFREGRVLLAGDAAHVHSPAGGQGMNTGIQDAVSLGSALAKVLHGGTDAPLTEWAEHRRRVAADIVTMTDRMTRAATIENPIGQSVRNAIVQFIGHLPAARRAIAMKLSELSTPAA